MLYPLKFRPKFIEKIWGGQKIQTMLGRGCSPDKKIGESWELYDFPPGIVDQSEQWVSSVVANGPLEGRTLHWMIEEFGRALHGDVRLLAPHGQFPLLVKYLDAREDLSLQVHPDAAYTAEHPGTHLKHEAWYIVQNDPGAKLYKSVRKGVSRAEFAAAARQGRAMEMVNAVPVAPGHCNYLPSGTVHALGAGILVAEVQTPSDTTFRIHDFGRIDEKTGNPRQLHLDEALECIDWEQRPEPKQPRSHVAGLFTTVSRLVTSPYFKLEKVRFTEGVEEAVPYDQPVVWIVLEGSAQVSVEGIKEPTSFGRGDVVLLPAQMKNPTIRTKSDCIWLETTFPTHREVE